MEMDHPRRAQRKSSHWVARIPSSDRLQSAAPLAIFVVARDIHTDEPITRESLMCMHKMEAEGGLEEEKIILGWYFNTHLLLISLPEKIYISHGLNRYAIY